jgi:hypothetical protein
VTTTAVPMPESAVEAAPRRARLERALTRVGGSVAGADRLERWLLIGGGVLLPLGLLVIVLGWYGASRTGRLFEQIPYLISGGMLGLGLVVAGGFFYFGYWLTRIVKESRAQADRAVEALARIEALLAGSGGWAGANGRGTWAGTLVSTATGTMAHRPDCPVVAGRDNLLPVPAGAPGYDTCKICQP